MARTIHLLWWHGYDVKSTCCGGVDMARKNALAVVAWIWREKHLLRWRGYGSEKCTCCGGMDMA